MFLTKDDNKFISRMWDEFVVEKYVVWHLHTSVKQHVVSIFEGACNLLPCTSSVFFCIMSYLLRRKFNRLVKKLTANLMFKITSQNKSRPLNLQRLRNLQNCWNMNLHWVLSVWFLQAVVAYQSWHASGHRGQPGSLLYLPCRRPSVTGPQRWEPAQRTSLQRLDGAGPTRGNNSDWLRRDNGTGRLVFNPSIVSSWKQNIKEVQLCFIFFIRDVCLSHWRHCNSVNSNGWSFSRETVLLPQASLLGRAQGTSEPSCHPPH